MYTGYELTHHLFYMKLIISTELLKLGSRKNMGIGARSQTCETEAGDNRTHHKRRQRHRRLHLG